jgi:chemotaxis protein MotA
MLGLVLSIACVVGAIVWDGGQLAAFVRFPVLALVLGGAFSATISSYYPKQLWNALRGYGRASRLETRKAQALVRFSRYAYVARHQGLLQLEVEAKKEPEQVVARALQALADGSSFEEAQCLAEACAAREVRDIGMVERFLESIGGYCPTFGLLGTVIGLVTMLAGAKQADAMAGGIASAFVATFYGMFLSNVVFLPWANRARETAKEYERYVDNLLLGVRLVQSGTAPLLLAERLKEAMGLTYMPRIQTQEEKPRDSRVVKIRNGQADQKSEQQGLKKRLARLG